MSLNERLSCDEPRVKGEKGAIMMITFAYREYTAAYIKQYMKPAICRWLAMYIQSNEYFCPVRYM